MVSYTECQTPEHSLKDQNKTDIPISIGLKIIFSPSIYLTECVFLYNL